MQTCVPCTSLAFFFSVLRTNCRALRMLRQVLYCWATSPSTQVSWLLWLYTMLLFMCFLVKTEQLLSLIAWGSETHELVIYWILTVHVYWKEENLSPMSGHRSFHAHCPLGLLYSEGKVRLLPVTSHSSALWRILMMAQASIYIGIVLWKGSALSVAWTSDAVLMYTST
jgi:hypothetical protein